jgi:hypothetical protein
MELGDAAQGPDPRAAPRGRQERGRLPLELAAMVSRKFGQGLDHVVRRRILRALHERPGGQGSAIELTGHELAGEALSSTAYHLAVLENYELIRHIDFQPVEGYRRRVFASLVDDDPMVLAVLVQTEPLDAQS